MLWFIFYRFKLLLKIEDDGTFSIPKGNLPPIEIGANTVIHKISPMEDGTGVRAFMIYDSLTKSKGFEMCTLRESFHKVSLQLYLKAGKCSEILYWDQNTRFCGICGSPMKLHTDISKRCTVCENEVWPNLATAVIILIHREDEVILVKSRNFSGNYYGLVAGFVETGESVEEAALREIKEEVGIEVQNLQYTMSQPWPYPSGIMIGFTAEYKKGEIIIQSSELSDGGWYKKDSLPQLPGEMGIARKMIEYWMNEKS